MTQEDIIRMGREAGLVSTYSRYDDWIDAGPSGEDLMAFAKLVAAAEREACAKVCENIETYEKIEKACFKFAAKKIRARGKQ